MIVHSMATQVLVVIPTFDHGPLLRLSIASALAQTHINLDLVVVCDGSPQSTVDLLEELSQRDARIRYVVFPKSARLGEDYRHEILLASDAGAVFYLCDDDLWCPDHVESLLACLERSDFAHALALTVAPGGATSLYRCVLQDDDDRSLVGSVENRVPLSAAAHTMAAYRRLPFGWRLTPVGTPTDWFMFRQWLGEDWVRAATNPVFTLVHFPSPDRLHRALHERIDELEAWSARVSDPQWLAERASFGLLTTLRTWRYHENETAGLRSHASALERQRADFQEQVRIASAHISAMEARIAAIEARIAAIEAGRAALLVRGPAGRSGRRRRIFGGPRPATAGDGHRDPKTDADGRRRTRGAGGGLAGRRLF